MSRRKKKLSPSQTFYQMHTWLVNSPAWRATNVYERSLYIELKQRYNGYNNGEISLSHREAAKALNCSGKPIREAFKGLIEKGLIRVAQVGSFHWKAGGGPSGRSTQWILTEYPVDLPVKSLTADRDFMRWKPAPEEKSRYDESTPMVGPEYTMERRMVG